MPGVSRACCYRCMYRYRVSSHELSGCRFWGVEGCRVYPVEFQALALGRMLRSCEEIETKARFKV